MIFIFLINTLVIINIHFLHSSLFGALFLVLYLIVNGYFVGKVTGKLFFIQESMIRLLFGALIVFLAVASFGGIFITFFRFNDFILSGVTLLVSLIAMEISEHNKGLFSVSMMREIIFNVLRSFRAIARELVNAPIPSVRTLILIAIILLFGLGFYTLFSLSYAEIYIKTPWDVIPDQFVLVIALLSLWLLYKIFTKPAFFLLVPIILFSLLQHLYIPAVYRLPYGGDTWRHTASMMEIEDNGFLSSSSYDTLKIGSFIMPSSVFTTSSYASFWAGGIFLNRALNAGLISIMVWWQYLIFSLALPILFFLLFDCICDKNRSVSLLGAFLPSLFFPMQAYGAVSLPVGFGFLVFMIFLLATVFWLKKREKKYFIALCIVLILLAIQYVVYVLFGALILGFLIVQKRTSRVLRIAYLIVSSALVPIISLFVSPNARLDILTTGASHILDFWKHTLLYLFGLKGMDGYYLHTGNLLWHSMRDRLTDLPLFSWNYLDTLLFFCFVAAISASIFWMCRRRAINNNPVSALFLYILFIGLMSIFLDRSYLGGIHLLTERLDLIIDTAFIFFLIGGFISVRDRYGRQPIFLWTSIVILAVMVGSTYSSGPIHGRVTMSHYNAMQALYVDMLKTGRTDYCVLSEHFPLAALESSSRGRVKNGNFPIKYGYLEEGGKIFIKMFSRPDILWMKEAAQKSKTRGCYFVLDQRFLVDWNKTQIRWLLGREVIEVDDVHIWRYDISTL